MGIKYFFSWLRNNFKDSIKTTPKCVMPNVDVLLFDMNGIFHNICAEVYEYGPYKKDHLLTPKRNKKELERKAFQKICEHVDMMVKLVQPKEKILLCIDGVAPQSKQNQQRSRRFKSARDKTEEEFNTFDSNCISPGTEWMDHLGKYMDFYIHSKVGKDWNFEVLFSNDKVQGEAEHKLIDYTRKLSEEDRKKSYMIYGMDADLVMLTLGTMLEKMYIIRENMQYGYFIIDVGDIRTQLYNKMNWNEEEDFDDFKHFYDYKNAIYDFIAMCFTVGNDFLPQIPSIEIYEGGIEIMFDNYKSVCKEYGHLTTITSDGVVFNKQSLKVFFECMKTQEKNILEQKLSKKELYFPDEDMERYMSVNDGKVELDFVKYKRLYNERKFGTDVKKSCHKYLEGMQWVLTYYIGGCKEWNWIYPFHYAPFMTDLVDHIDDFSTNIYKSVSTPCNPFFQLVRILPPKSRNLIPFPLQRIFDGKLKQSFPETFEVDLKGKKKEWEGIVLIPFLNDKEMQKEYNQCVRELEDKDKRRNMFGKVFYYKPSTFISKYTSYYGDIVTYCNKHII
jgi:5'-3' exonuclease